MPINQKKKRVALKKAAPAIKRKVKKTVSKMKEKPSLIPAVNMMKKKKVASKTPKGTSAKRKKVAAKKKQVKRGTRRPSTGIRGTGKKK